MGPWQFAFLWIIAIAFLAVVVISFSTLVIQTIFRLFSGRRTKNPPSGTEGTAARSEGDL